MENAPAKMISSSPDLLQIAIYFVVSNSLCVESTKSYLLWAKKKFYTVQPNSTAKIPGKLFKKAYTLATGL